MARRKVNCLHAYQADGSPKMKVSMILATINRTRELAYFLEHLDAQTYRDFELIVADQNQDERLAPIIGPYQDRFPVLHLRRIPRGASKARNIGLKYASGDIIAFPDDDCWYPPTLLEEVASFFRQYPDVDVVVPDQGKNSLIGCLMNFIYQGKPRRVSLFSLPGTVQFFVRRRVIDEVGGFDETLGPGSMGHWEGAEDWDFLIRILKAKFKVQRVPWIPRVQYVPDSSVKKAYRYGISAGYVWKKNNLPVWTFVMRLALSAFNILTFISRGQGKRGQWAMAWLRGFVKGWLGKYA